MVIEAVDLPLHPLDVLDRWPPDRPLFMLHSGGTPGRWSRWTILASPSRWFTGSSITALAAAMADTRQKTTRAGPAIPFVGGWIGYLSYELGRVLEPAVRRPAAPRGPRRVDHHDDRWPLIQMAWCPAALVHDGLTGTWHAVGGLDLASILRRTPERTGPEDPVEVGAWSSSMLPDDYLAAVRRTLDYIAAGDVFQANITQRLSAPFRGPPRRLARRAVGASRAWYGAYLELPGDRAIVSMSPELFLETEPVTGRVRTRPIKGTRPRHADPAELAASAKDAAELHMIVDLMRNDLGRICRYGTIDVPAPRTIETHATVHHGVGEVTGVLRDGTGLAELLRATMPAGSVTGAPKIRAMQIIEELEPVARGPYCGAIGFVSDHGRVGLNVAIRTLAITGAGPRGVDGTVEGIVDYGVGAGIVADSEPVAESRECLDKAAVLCEVLTRPRGCVAAASAGH